MTKQYFNSNETLEMCDVRISENGTIEVATKSSTIARSCSAWASPRRLSAAL